jgi:hypothetical protein
VTEFNDFLANRVLELEERNRNLRASLTRARKSRDLWTLRALRKSGLRKKAAS